MAKQGRARLVFEVVAKVLAAAVQEASSVASRKGTMPILSCVRLAAREGAWR